MIVIASTRPDHAHSRVDVSSACSTGAACRFQSWADQAGWEGGCATLKRGRRSLSVADPRRSLSLDGRSISGQERGRIGTGMRKPDVAAMRPRGVITTMTTRTPADAAGPRGSEAGGEGEGSDRSILFVPIRSILSLPIRSILPLPIEGSDRSILSVPIVDSASADTVDSASADRRFRPVDSAAADRTGAQRQTPVHATPPLGWLHLLAS